MNDDELLKKLKRLDRLKKDFAYHFYAPYPKQKEFHEMGAGKRERLLMAANKIGKTYAAGFEIAYHTTGYYPDWWQGRRFTKPNRGWVGSVTAEMARDGAQRILLGPPGRFGIGTIPKDRLVDIKKARGVPDAIESVLVRHMSGEPSQLVFKSYKDGREAWQAEDLDWVWFDEEPPMDVYTEGLTRTNNTGGFAMLTFTPLMGMTQVVMRYMNEANEDRGIVGMTIEDAGHYTPEERTRIVEAYLPHEREARSKGIPMLGSGRIFPIAESVIVEPTLANIPSHWRQIIGLDFGWDHPTAAVRIAYDGDNDTIHLVSAYRQSEAVPLIHAAAVRPWGEWIPVAWPRDGSQHDKASGDQLADMYRKQGLKMISEHASYADERGESVEPGLLEMLQRMQTGRFKVDENLSQWLEEFRIYHRKDGKIIKIYDDLMSATRYAMMMLRFAIPREWGEAPPDRYARHGRFTDSRTWMSA